MTNSCTTNLAAQLLLTGILGSAAPLAALLGDWTLDQSWSANPDVMRTVQEEEKTMVSMRIYIGFDGPFVAEFVDGRLKFALKRGRKKNKALPTVDVGLTNRKLDGIVNRVNEAGVSGKVAFTGKRIPPMPVSAPDLSEVRFGKPISNECVGMCTYSVVRRTERGRKCADFSSSSMPPSPVRGIDPKGSLGFQIINTIWASTGYRSQSCWCRQDGGWETLDENTEVTPP